MQNLTSAVNDHIRKQLTYSYRLEEMLYVNKSRKYLRIGIYASACIFIFTVLIVPLIIAMNNDNSNYKRNQINPTDLKYILFWREDLILKLGKLSQEFETGQSMFIKQECTYYNCYITYNKNFFRSGGNFDALVFAEKDAKVLNESLLNVNRTPEQLYIFKSRESSAIHALCNRFLDNFFNLIWSYRLDSDILDPFFNIYNTKGEVIGPRNNITWIEKRRHRMNPLIYKSKSKVIAWIPPRRRFKIIHTDFINDLTDELKKFNYTLDILGPNGSPCKGTGPRKCQKHVEKDYYFQLVLEEYFSIDYVTASIVTVMQHNVIPIVLGGANYSYFLPPGSYINAQTYDAKKLVALIDYLMKTPFVYNLFFDWKRYYTFRTRPKYSVCELCKKLNEHNRTLLNYKHFRSWWDPDFRTVCRRKKIVKSYNIMEY